MPADNTVYVSIELSVSSWLVATRLPGIEKSRLQRLEGGDAVGLLKTIAELRLKASAKLGSTANVVCCFEAGRDGFWLHRLLTANGISAYILEPTSILVNRRARRAKTDRLDAEGMLRVLITWLAGDRQVCSMVRVPTPDERSVPQDGDYGTGAQAACRALEVCHRRRRHRGGNPEDSLTPALHSIAKSTGV
jgi:transposase